MIKISDLFKASDEYASLLPKIMFESSTFLEISLRVYTSRFQVRVKIFGNLKNIDKAIAYHQLTGENQLH